MVKMTEHETRAEKAEKICSEVMWYANKQISEDELMNKIRNILEQD